MAVTAASNFDFVNKKMSCTRNVYDFHTRTALLLHDTFSSGPDHTCCSLVCLKLVSVTCIEHDMIFFGISHCEILVLSPQ